MDLLAGVRKEGSRGGRADFKWEDVKQDAHRENYLGHSLMAPVGRWQKNRDLSWYAKGDAPTADAAARERAEELRRIKEAEQDALSEALGFPVDREARERRRMMEEQQRQMEQESGGALAPGEVERAVKEGLVEDRGELGIDGGAKGLGAGKWNGKLEEREVMSGVGVGAPVEKPGKERDRGSKRDRSRSRERRDRDRDRRDRHHHRRERSEEDRTRRRRSRSRSRDRERERRRRSRSRDGGRAYRRDDDYRRGNIDRRRPRSRSPDRRRGEGRYREDHHERRK